MRHKNETNFNNTVYGGSASINCIVEICAAKYFRFGGKCYTLFYLKFNRLFSSERILKIS